MRNNPGGGEQNPAEGDRRRYKNSSSVLFCIGKRTIGCTNVVVRSPPLNRKVGRNGETIIPRGSTIQLPPIVWILEYRQLC